MALNALARPLNSVVPVIEMYKLQSGHYPESMAALTWGVILVGIGTLWLLDRYVDLDAFWAAVGDWLAPASFILFGVILITTYVMRKRRHNAAEVWPPRG